MGYPMARNLLKLDMRFPSGRTPPASAINWPPKRRKGMRDTATRPGTPTVFLCVGNTEMAKK